MLDVVRPPVQHHVARRPVALPLHYLHIIPPQTTPEAEGLFHLPQALSDLFYQQPWDRITHAVAPAVWAPGWSEGDEQAFLGKTYNEEVEPERRPQGVFLPSSFGGLVGLAAHEERTEADIVHIHDVAFMDGGWRLRAGGQWIDQDTLRRALAWAETRLLILQTSALGPATELGLDLVERGGPAVLIIDSEIEGGHETALSGLMLAIVHNSPLEEWEHLAAEGTLILGDNSRDLFDLEPYLNALQRRLEDAREETVEEEYRSRPGRVGGRRRGR